MNVIIIDASEKKAARRSRRILSQWFPQLGPDTYSGRLSEEGLRDLVKLLRTAASRNTAIAIHKVVTRDRQELVTIIGNKSHFNEQGHWAFRVSTRKVLMRKQTPLELLLKEVNKLSGLMHDLGKMMVQFQEFLRGIGIGQRVRHDTLGYWIFQQALMRSLTSKKSTDLEWLTLLQNPEAFFANAVDTETGVIRLDARTLSSISEPNPLESLDPQLSKTLYSPGFREQLPLGLAVGWLILTHHRLIQPNKAYKYKEEFPSPSLLRHVNLHVPNMPDLNFKTITKEVPWKHPQWVAAVSRCATAILSLLHANPSLIGLLKEKQQETYFGGLLYIQRPALIVGDQLASTQQADVLRRKGTKKSFAKDLLYANSVERQPDFAGDYLQTHLLSVSKKAGFIQDLILNAKDWFPSVSTDNLLPNNPLVQDIPRDSRFYWQKLAADRLGKLENVANRPAFIGLVSAPGSGKTLAAIRILKALSQGEFRVTVGLGLKSLTFQTGTAYKEKIGFSEEDVAVLVGDKAARMIYDANRKDLQVPSTPSDIAAPQAGSESLIAEAENFSFEGDVYAPRGAWFSSLQPPNRITSGGGIFSNKLARLIDAPILVCTVDHLAHVTGMLRPGDAKLILRVASSDLILDELDGYSSNDLATLGKLVFLHGVYGRRVLVMSGSMSSSLVSSFHDAWLRGIKVFQTVKGNAEVPVAALISNLTEPVIMHGVAPESFEAQAKDFCFAFGDELEKQPGKVKADIHDMSTDIDRGIRWEESIVSAALKLHRANSVIDSESGKPFSAGFVRMNKTRTAQALARHLMRREQQEGEPEIKVICYHSKYPKLLRALIENFLDKAMSREQYAIPPHDLVAKALKSAKDTGVILIVPTTSIEETGRDHDFDWAILEPSSARSAIQAAGRVSRHRERTRDTVNLYILDTTIAALEGSSLPYGRAGLQDNPKFSNTAAWLVKHPKKDGELARDLDAAQIRYELGSSDIVTSTEQLLPMNKWKKKLTPREALVVPEEFEESRLSALGHVELLSKLGGPGGEALQTTLKGFFNSGGAKVKDILWLDARHARAFGFRQSSHVPELTVCINYANFNSFRVVDENGVLREVVPHAAVSIKYPERALLRLDQDLEAQFKALCEAQGWGTSIINLLGEGKTPYDAEALAYGPSFSFNALLGFARLDKKRD